MYIYCSLCYCDKEGKIYVDYNVFWELVGGVCDVECYYCFLV